MLPLDDDRWGCLSTFFEEPDCLPDILSKWMRSIGSNLEETFYQCDLLDLFLHQASITNAAFGVVPWLVHVCKQGNTKFRAMYLTDVAMVEVNRLKTGLHYNRKGTEQYPEWLMTDYHQAIIEARQLAEITIKEEADASNKQGLIALKPALYGDADLAWSQWSGASNSSG
jgi:hypothetical protein